MTLGLYYQINHRLSSTHYSLTEIEQMLPYERDIYLALVHADHEQSQANK